jgi:hypothetical protein
MCPYYMGDYMGDYYGGDPGLLSGIGRFLGRAAGGFGLTRRALPAMRAIAPIIPGGAAIVKATGMLSRAAGMGKMIVRAHPAGTAVAGVVASAGALAAIRHRGSPAGAGMATMAGMQVGPAGIPMRGFHVSRRTGALVRNRRMRVTNPKALHRAIRRATGFARLARKVLHFTSPKAPRGRAVFRAKRRSTKRLST